MSSIALSFNNVDLVSIDGGEPRTTSLAVAKKFGKRHANVLQAIDNIECSDTFKQLNFKLVMESMTYANKDGMIRSKQTKRVGHVEMTKDGFMFLAMGFTGKKAAEFKEWYINEFNRMADKLAVQQDDIALDGLCIDWAQVTSNLTQAGRYLSVAGNQTKPSIEQRIAKIMLRKQPELPNLELKK